MGVSYRKYQFLIGRTRLEIPNGSCQAGGTKGTRCEVPDKKNQKGGIKQEVPERGHQIKGTRYAVPGLKYKIGRIS